jgi:hypothetical protein
MQGIHRKERENILLTRTGLLMEGMWIASRWPVIRPESGPDLVTQVVSAIACFRRAAKLFGSLRRISG